MSNHKRVGDSSTSWIERESMIPSNLDIYRGPKQEFYKYSWVPKLNKDGTRSGWRKIEEPIPELKLIQQTILNEIEKEAVFPAYIFGVKGRSAIDNALYHRDQEIIISLDIKDCFQHTSPTNIYPNLQGISTALVENILNFCFLNGRLPTGAPTSPILCNLILKALIDKRLRELAHVYGLKYSRYMDDLTFSGSFRPKGFIKEVIIAIAPNYTLNFKKIGSFHRAYQQQKVTGVVINSQLSVPREDRKVLRAKLDKAARTHIHNARYLEYHNPISGLEDVLKLLDEETRGKLSYVKSVNKEQWHQLAAHYAKRLQFYRKIVTTSPSPK